MSASIKGSQLADLAEIRAALLEQRRRAESLAAVEHQRVLAERREQSVFATAVGAVVPLKKSATPLLEQGEANLRQIGEVAALDRRLHSKPRSANDTACPWPTTR